MKHKIMQYEMVPVSDVRGLNLNSTDKLVMGLIVSLTRKTDRCTVSNEFFSEQLELKKENYLKINCQVKRKESNIS